MSNFTIGSYEWFLNVFWPINPISNSTAKDPVQSAFFHSERAIQNNVTLPNGEVLTWEILIKRYDDFVKYMKPLQNGQFTKKENVLLSIEDYVVGRKYLSDFSKHSGDPNDFYLFGL